MDLKTTTPTPQQAKLEKRWLGPLVTIALYFWSLIIYATYFLTMGLSPIFAIAKNQLTNRFNFKKYVDELSKKRLKADGCTLFFCSSAGEYEQAKPIIDRLKQTPSHLVVIFFFSASGYSYAYKRQEESPFFMCPPDVIWIWQKIFDQLSPGLTLIVRHELWPSFLASAWQHGQVVLINASAPIHKQPSLMSTMSKRLLMSFLDKIFVVAEKDRDYFTSYLQVPGNKVIIAGDTKYDRAKERQASMRQRPLKWKEDFERLGQGSRWLIVGSAWPADYELTLQAFSQCLKRSVGFHWNMIVALHQPTEESLATLIESCEAKQFPWIRLSQIQNAKKFEDPVIVIVDNMGILAELYGQADLAFVGGAMHYQVHNVLEPCIYGLKIAFGPKYKNSHEAISLVTSGHAKVVEELEDLVRWWISNSKIASPPNAVIMNHLESFYGASEKIIGQLK
jgi:3-deoxy-D-manno-octulosonic-acid transferase